MTDFTTATIASIETSVSRIPTAVITENVSMLEPQPPPDSNVTVSWAGSDQVASNVRKYLLDKLVSW